MNRQDIQLLQQYRGYPALTITLPTHRASPENRQDSIRLKNLVIEAGNRLLGEFPKREIGPFLARLEQLAASLDYRQNLDGLALFVNREYTRALRLPFPLKERVLIDETFATRDLVFALNRSPRYWVLALSEKPTRLYEGVRETLQEVQSDDFPMIHTGPGGEAPLPGGFGIRKSAYRDERHRQFFRQVDNAFKPFAAADPLPLALVGVDRQLAFFNEVTSHREAVVAMLTGSHDKTPPHKLGSLVWPLVRENMTAQRRQALSQLEQAVGERRFASAPGEVWRAANEGRGDLLLVEENFHFPARLDESGEGLIPAADPTAADVLDDAVDEIIKTVSDKQGRVVFVEDGQLAQHQRIALILRY